MATHSYTAQRIAASLIGAGLVGLSGYLTWEHSHDFTAPIAAIVGAGMFHFGESAWRARRWLTGALLGLLGLLAVAISLGVVIDRTSSRYDAAHQSRATENLPRVAAEQVVTEAKQALTTAEAAVSAECLSGVGPRCTGLETRVAKARERLKTARDELTKLGAHTAENPSEKRIAAWLGVSEAQVAMAQPLLLPIWIELSGLALLTYGLSSSGRKRRDPETVALQANLDVAHGEIETLQAALDDAKGEVEKLAKALRKAKRNGRKGAPRKSPTPSKAATAQPSLKLVAASGR
jgi:hypothetical protein